MVLMASVWSMACTWRLTRIPTFVRRDLLSVDVLCSRYHNYIDGGGFLKLIHTFAVNVRFYRLKAGLSQEKLAELASLHRTYISAVERERRNISIENIESIAVALNVDAYKLFQPLKEED